MILSLMKSKEMLKDRCNIVLIGMPSAGKTTIGKMLEEKLGKEFFDLDDMIIAKAGKSIPDLPRIWRSWI